MSFRRDVLSIYSIVTVNNSTRKSKIPFRIISTNKNYKGNVDFMKRM